MLAERTIKIIKDFCQFIDGGDCSEWCVGVTAKTEQHLLRELKIPPDPRWYIYRQATSALDASAVAKAFWNIECQKHPGSLDPVKGSEVYVFAYRMQPFLTAAVSGEVRSQGAPANLS